MWAIEEEESETELLVHMTTTPNEKITRDGSHADATVVGRHVLLRGQGSKLRPLLGYPFPTLAPQLGSWVS